MLLLEFVEALPRHPLGGAARLDQPLAEVLRQEIHAWTPPGMLEFEEIDRSESAGPTGDSGRRSSVPSSGKPAKGKGKDSPGGLEPEPQPET